MPFDRVSVRAARLARASKSLRGLPASRQTARTRATPCRDASLPRRRRPCRSTWPSQGSPTCRRSTSSAERPVVAARSAISAKKISPRKPPAELPRGRGRCPGDGDHGPASRRRPRDRSRGGGRAQRCVHRSAGSGPCRHGTPRGAGDSKHIGDNKPGGLRSACHSHSGCRPNPSHCMPRPARRSPSSRSTGRSGARGPSAGDPVEGPRAAGRHAG